MYVNGRHIFGRLMGLKMHVGETTRPSARQELAATLGLAVPIIVGLAAFTLIGVVDTIMISPLGTTPMAGAALTGTALTILYSALYGLVTVIGIEIANRFGARETAAASGLVRNGAVMSLGMGALAAIGMLAVFPLLSYAGQPPAVLDEMYPYWATMALSLVPFTALIVFKGMYDAIGRPWIGTAFAFASVIVNVPLNWVLIHGVGAWPGLGLFGAGLASFVSEVVSLALAWAYWRYAASMAQFRQPAPVSFGVMWRQVKDGSPVALAYTGEGSSYAMIGLMVGWFGAGALAANQIVGSISGVLYMLPLGMAAAVGIRIGQVLGEGEVHRVRRIGLGAVGSVVGWTLIVTLSLLWLRVPISNALSQDPEVVALALVMFLTVAIMQVADGVQSTVLGALRGLVDNTVPSLVTLVAYWPVALQLAYFFAFVLELGPAGLWVGYGLGLTVAATTLFFRFLRKTRG